jgi:two-component system cell cycle response regulator
MLDVDRFKLINDGFGHTTGDRVLVALARTLEAHVRPYDLVARLGGDEFLILMPDLDEEEALEVADRLREAVSLLRAVGYPHVVTVSLGIAMHRPGLSAERLLQIADEALYRAKAKGRNRVELRGA